MHKLRRRRLILFVVDACCVVCAIYAVEDVVLSDEAYLRELVRIMVLPVVGVIVMVDVVPW